MAASPTRATLFAMLVGMVAVLEAAEERRPVLPPPPPPAESEQTAPAPPPSSDAIEPEITITSKGTEIHEEYRYRGMLYRVKVIPAHGPPYYLIYDERGNFRRSDLEPNLIVPEWVIKRF